MLLVDRRVQEEREATLLAPWGMKQRREPRAALPGAGARAAHVLPARPRPHHPQLRVPAARVQDPGLRQPRGRPLPHPAHPHHRGRADRAHDRPGAAAQRGPRRVPRPRPRPRAHALRPLRRAGAERADARSTAASSTTARACGSSRCSRSAIPSSPASTSPGRCARASSSTGPTRPRRARRSSRPEEPPTLEAQIVDFVDEIAYNNHDIDDGLASGMFTVERDPRAWRSSARPTTTRCAAGFDDERMRAAPRGALDHRPLRERPASTTTPARASQAARVDSVDDVRRAGRAARGLLAGRPRRGSRS